MPVDNVSCRDNFMGKILGTRQMSEIDLSRALLFVVIELHNELSGTYHSFSVVMRAHTLYLIMPYTFNPETRLHSADLIIPCSCITWID